MPETRFLTIIGAEVAVALAFVLAAFSVLRGPPGLEARPPSSEVLGVRRIWLDRMTLASGLLLLVLGGLGLALNLLGAGLPAVAP